MKPYEHIVRPLLFRFDAERMHDCSVRALQCMGRIAPVRELIRRRYLVRDPRLRCEFNGLTFDNPIGLAAGYDKNALAVRGLAALGFGFLEVGSVSIDPSPGNPKPRLFRLPARQAIVVHYGLPNRGAEAMVSRLRGVSPNVPLGINVVNTNRLRAETADQVLADFRHAVRVIRPSADYLVLNLSCPNTETGRECCTDHRFVAELLRQLADQRIDVPLFLKVSPLGGEGTLDSLLESIEGFDEVTGFIFNTPSGKPAQLGLTPEEEQSLPGAVTGPVHESLMNTAIANLYRRMDQQRYRIIGVGGVFSAADAYRKIRLGASLVQLFTALIYRGPGVVRSINEGLIELLERDGFANIGDAVGVDVN